MINEGLFIRSLKPARFGNMAILWKPHPQAPRVVRVFLTPPGAQWKSGSCEEIETLSKRIEGFLSGDEAAVPLDLADLDICTPFQRSVLLLECTVPRGRITTYGSLALKLGSGARAVGNALAANPFPLIVPCHRAVRSDRSIGGFQGGAGMKRALLALEGVEFDRRGLISHNENMWVFPVT